jgi:hypothetical protein
MPVGDLPGEAGDPLSREQVLEELDFLATVEHALVVEYLSVCCALGHDLQTDEGGPTTEQGRNAAAAASQLALGEMFHLKGVNRALVKAGGSAQVERAGSISSAAAGAIPLGPPTREQLERLLEREDAIARAVDDRYNRLRPAVTSAPVFEGELLDELRSVIVDDGPSHAAGLADLRDALRGVAPAEFLRATRRVARDSFEERLLDVSDRSYRLVLSAVRELFGEEFAVAGAFRGFAVAAMEGLEQIDRVLVQRGLLPPFTA